MLPSSGFSTVTVVKLFAAILPVGRDVAEFVRKHFPSELLKNSAYRSGNFKQALSTTCTRMDAMLRSELGRRELRTIVKGFTSQHVSPVGSPKKVPGSPEPPARDAFSEGCTANVVLIHNRTLYSANVGDSKTVLIASNGVAVELTKDHKPGEEGEAARIGRAGGSVINGRVNGDLNVSRTLGDLRYKSDKSLGAGEQLISPLPDVTAQSLADGIEYVLIGSDGVFGGTKSLQEVTEFVTKDRRAHPEDELSGTVERLLDFVISPNCVQTGGVGGDNMTCILLRVGGP